MKNCNWGNVKSALLRGGRNAKCFENLYVIDVDTDGCYVDMCININRHGVQEVVSFGAFIPSSMFIIESEDDAYKLLSNREFLSEFEDEFEECYRDWEFGTIEV